MPKKYLVTGAAGFIGSTLAKKLLQTGADVWTIDNLTTGRQENLPAQIRFIKGDCQDPASIEQLKGTTFDAILHFAGQSSGEISFDDPVYDLRTNTESTLRLIQYGLKHSCPRFLYASSMSVYGIVPDRPVPETHPATPLSFYGVGKLASEHYLRIYQSKGLKPTALRLFNVYGARQNMSNLRQGMVSIYLAQWLKQDRVIVKGAADRFRDFISVEDVVDFTASIIDEPRSFGQIVNVGTGVRTTVEQLLGLMAQLSGTRREIVLTEGTPGDQKGIYADISVLKNNFGFHPRVSLEKGLSEMITWARQSDW